MITALDYAGTALTNVQAAKGILDTTTPTRLPEDLNRISSLLASAASDLLVLRLDHPRELAAIVIEP